MVGAIYIFVFYYYLTQINSMLTCDCYVIDQRKLQNVMLIAHFRVALSLSIKARPGVQPFI